MNSYTHHFKKTVTLALPVCFSQLGHIFVGLVDTAMVGRLGTTPQAAVSLANSFFTMVLVFGIGLSYSITPLVASADTEHNQARISTLLKHGLLLCVVFGILLFALLYMIAPGIYYLNQPKDVTEQAVPFLNVLMLSMVPLSIFFALKQFTEGLSLTRIAMVVSVLGNLLNVLLNWLLIYGKWGFPQMGLMGSCWATFFARVFMATGMLLYIFSNQKFKAYTQIFKQQKFRKETFMHLLKIGVPAGMQFVFEVGAFGAAAIMIGWLGAQSLAAHQIALNLAAATYMIATGISAAATVRVGNQMGVKNRDELVRSGNSALLLACAFMLFSALVFIFTRSALPAYFNPNQEVITLASGLLIIAAFFQISDGTQVVALGVLRGMEDVRIPTVMTLIAYWVIGLPIGYVLGFKFNYGIYGIWAGLLIGLSMSAIMLVGRFRYLAKRIDFTVLARD